MELLAPAGNLEKLKTVYQYGADAAYIGINNFSLRQKADNFYNEDYLKLNQIKGDKKLFGAFNISFHNTDLARLKDEVEMIRSYPLDAFIISDIGLVPFLQKEFPDKALHLSTQANCINKEAAAIYQDMGFTRVILGREASLNEIKEIKDYRPELELETFIHGAMCLAYSGRCFLSRYMADRSANKGSCAHTCRWQYSLHQSDEENTSCSSDYKKLAESGKLAIEEELRPGNYFPIYEGNDFTTILSSRDLCLIDHLAELKAAGIDSFKIEGRMKSLYYAAVITRAYRKGLDITNGASIPDFDKYREEIFKVSHREFTTGFFFGDQEIQRPTTRSYLRQQIFVGTIDDPLTEPQKTEALTHLEEPARLEFEVAIEKQDFSKWNLYPIQLKNQIRSEHKIEYIGPDQLFFGDDQFYILNEKFHGVSKSDHGKVTYILTQKELKEGFLVRRPTQTKEDPFKNQAKKDEQ